jgi:hypothetical protein
METKKQTELINYLFSQISDNDKLFCEPIIDHLLSLGYSPEKQIKTKFFVVKFAKNGRLIARFEIPKEKNGITPLLFCLRFSACENYSKVFQDAAGRRYAAMIKRNENWVDHNIEHCCGNCKGEPRFYCFYDTAGNKIRRCGGQTTPVAGVTSDNVPEAIRLINEQDVYFTKFLNGK